MNGPIRRLAIGVFGAMGALLLAVTWFQVVQADDLRSDPLNPRPALSERGKERGVIVTTDGTVTVEAKKSGKLLSEIGVSNLFDIGAGIDLPAPTIGALMSVNSMGGTLKAFVEDADVGDGEGVGRRRNGDPVLELLAHRRGPLCVRLRGRGNL